ncbi:hypothetical protein ACFY12_13280 [Streptomyces sp. NPDC001339]|uniref:hypothetical protein n=1 Tax=Streptomyces sp. NPDC001339 TaxID=3364563 RepID=UPI00367DC74A
MTTTRATDAAQTTKTAETAETAETADTADTAEKTKKAEKVREAEEAHHALRRALRHAGIQLPAMDVRPVRRLDGDGYALLNLGECSAPVARALADVIEKGSALPGEVVRNCEGTP